jgi:hypothetical protein
MRMNAHRWTQAALLAWTLSASADPNVSTTNSRADALPLEEATELCIRLHEEAFVCKEEFIDLVIDLRGKYDPRFAKVLASREGRAAAKAEGLKEAVADGSGELEPRRRKCARYAAHGPPVPKADRPFLQACYTKPSCLERVACMKPVLERRFADRAKALGQKNGSSDEH